MEKQLQLYVLINGNIGPFAPELVEAWEAAGLDGVCVRCTALLEEGWCGPQCPKCVREYQEAKGCRCRGENLCPACRMVGATDAVREPKCSPDCSTLCAVCCPDD